MAQGQAEEDKDYVRVDTPNDEIILVESYCPGAHASFSLDPFLLGRVYAALQHSCLLSFSCRLPREGVGGLFCPMTVITSVPVSK